MREKKSEKFKIDLDLTSMLDVIFIILMVVMCQLRLNAVGDKESIEGLEAELSEAKETAAIYETQLQSIENAETEVAFLTLFVDFENGDPTVRHLKLLRSENPEIEDMELRPGTEDEGFARFNETMRAYLSEKPELPVLLTLDEEQILYRDQVRMTQLLEELKADYPNLFLRNREQ